MPYHITVHRRADDAFFRSHPDVASHEFDAWCDECQARWVYVNPLGAGGTVFEWWHDPAIELGLPLLGSVYQDGLEVEGERLAELGRELDALERYWDEADFSRAMAVTLPSRLPDGTQDIRVVPQEQDLRERLGYLREAIRVASECDGVVTIS